MNDANDEKCSLCSYAKQQLAWLIYIYIYVYMACI